MLCFYRAMLRRVQNCYGKSYVRLSVALRYRGWNALKIISWLIILGFCLSVDPNIIDSFQREHTEILARIGVGYGKKVAQFGVQKL